jgi:hypothetical protein
VAVPTIANVYPNRVHTSARGLVRILGGDFAPEVAVHFGGVPSPRVMVVNHALLFAEVPPAPAGEVTLSVQNLNLGQPIAGELAEAVLPFSYARVLLTDDSVLTQVVEAFVLMLRQEIIPNVTTAHVHTDYDESTGDTYNLTELQTLPSLVVVGPEVTESEEQVAAQPLVPGFGFQVPAQLPYYGDLHFTITGASDSQRQLLNLQSLTLATFHRHAFVDVPRDPAAPTQGSVRFELDMETGGIPSISTASDENNVRTFVVRVVIRNVPLGELPGVNPPATDVVPPVGDCGVELSFIKL